MNITFNKADNCLVIDEQIYHDCYTEIESDLHLYPEDLWKNGFSDYFTLSQKAIDALSELMTDEGIMIEVIE